MKSQKEKPVINPDVLVNDLPKEIKTVPKEDLLTKIFKDISKKEVPVSSFIRMWTMGSTQAKIALGYLAYGIKSNFVNKTEKDRLLNETNLNTALKLFATMGYLRGIMIKTGQILGNLDHVLPDVIAETLSGLQFEAPPMHYSMIREIFLDEIGRDPEEVFESFDKKAFAAASIGQVHKAKLKTGEIVAVKIQYPNIARTITSDIKALCKLFSPMRLSKEQKYIIDHLKDAEKMLLVETDYLEEADNMKKIKKIFRKEDEIFIPKVFEKYSSKRVLTMEYISGSHLKEFLLSNPDQKTRNYYGEKISTAIFRIWYRQKAIYTDLNPGNFIFMGNGQLGIVDFGSIRFFDSKEWKIQLETERAMINKDYKRLDELTAEICFFDSVEEAGKDRINTIRQLSLWQARPVLTKEDFDFSDRSYYKEGIDLYTVSMKKQYNRFNSLYNWWQRLIIGHRTLMYRLGSSFNYHNVYFQVKNDD